MSKTIVISDECFNKLKDQLTEEEQVDISSLNDMIGKSFFFRTVTYHMTGKVKKLIGRILQLEDAAWIADSGRFEQCIKDGKLNEVEPLGTAFINLDTCVDFFPWKHKLPCKQI